MPRRLQLLSITLVLLVAAALRIVALTRLPPGFSDDEINTILTSGTVRHGMLASFYNVGDPAGGREGLFPLLQAVVTSVVGDGLLCYRLLSLCCGLVSVALMYALAWRLFGYFPAIVAAIVLTTSLWPVILARSAIREALLLPLILAALFVLARAVHLYQHVEAGPPSTIAYTALGVLLAAMAYTHWVGLLGAPLVIFFLIYLVVSRQPISRRVLSLSAFSLLLTAILSIPYFTFTLRAFRMSGLYVFWATRPPGIGPMFSSALKTIASIVIVGDPSATRNLPGNALIGPAGAGLVVAIRARRAPNMGFTLLTLGVGLLPGVWSRDDADFSRTLLALPALMMLVGLGAESVRQRIWRRPTSSQYWQQAALTIVATALGIIIVSYGLFVQWASDGAVESAYRARLGRLATYLDRTRDGLSTSICTFNLQNGTKSSLLSDQISDPALLGLMIHRRDLELRYSDCLTGLVLTKGGAVQRFAFADAKAREVISPPLKDWLKAAETIPVDGLPDGTVLKIDVEKDLADASGKLALSQVEWAPEAATGTSSAVTLPVRMGGYLTFEGYQLPMGTSYHPGDTINVITYWRADGSGVPPDLRLFIHMLNNPNTEPVIQNDILSVDADSLADRDVFIQILQVPLPLTLPPNTYYLSIGIGITIRIRYACRSLMPATSEATGCFWRKSRCNKLCLKCCFSARPHLRPRYTGGWRHMSSWSKNTDF